MRGTRGSCLASRTVAAHRRRRVCEHGFVSRAPAILHADADAFFAAVEQRDDPRLRGRPVIVGTGVVMAASYEARRLGVRTAMGGALARRLCPHAIVVPPRFHAYTDASKALFRVFEEHAPRVEGLSLEEAFLDVTELERVTGSPGRIAVRLRRDVREQIGLAVTVGGATTKVVAKAASRAAKPDGVLVLAPGDELGFLHPLPVGGIWGIGPATTERLRACGIETVGDAATWSEADLVAALGPAGGCFVHRVSRNRDRRVVASRQRRRSFGSQSAGRRSPDAADAVLVALADRVAYRMRVSGRRGRTVVLRLRFDDFGRATRSATLHRPTAETRTILAVVRDLFEASLPVIRQRGLTLVGIAVGNLDDRFAPVQLVLPLDDPAAAALDEALDAVRGRFGADAITLGTLVRRRGPLLRSPAAFDPRGLREP